VNPFGELDFIYMPSSDVAADLGFYEEILGGEVVFAIEAFGTRVAEVRLAPGGPRLLLASHLGGEAPVLVHRVDDLDAALSELESRGLELELRFEIPPGPCAALRTPGGQRLALYERSRDVDRRFRGRRDF
jgi:catechol 2,3-dioxygenase-like lactoylglutathione lyase family enzyme